MSSLNNIILYEYGRYPVMRCVNIRVYKRVVDEYGNIYEMDENFAVDLLKRTPLKAGYLYTDLNEMQMKLFVKLTNED